MLKDITLGQFFPGESIVHRLDPRVKLLLTVLFIVELFLVNTLAGYAFILLFLLSVVWIARLSLRLVLRSVRPLLFIIILTAVLNVFYTSGTVLWEFWILHVTKEGVVMAVYMALRIALLIIGTSLLTYTTSPIDLCDAIERLMKPLKLIRVPVGELAMMMTIALRFIPTLIDETDKIMSAQKARGADFESGSLIARAKALIPILVPLFVSSFRSADELAVAMECRCYTGGDNRTRMKTMTLHARDFLVSGLVTAFIPLILLVLNRLQLGWF